MSENIFAGAVFLRSALLVSNETAKSVQALEAAGGSVNKHPTPNHQELGSKTVSTGSANLTVPSAEATAQQELKK